MRSWALALVTSIVIASADPGAPSRTHLTRLLRPFLDSHWPFSPPRRDDDTSLFRYRSRPDLRPPKWEITVFNTDDLGPGYWFVAPYAHLDQVEFPPWNGPHIYDGNGELIWSGVAMFDHYNTFDFRTVDMNDQMMLSLIYPQDQHGAGVIINDRYVVETTVDLLGTFEKKNMHDFTVVDDGRYALAMTVRKGNSTLADANTIGVIGECCATWDGFKELQVEGSKVVFAWDSEGHLGLDESTKITGYYQQMCRDCWDAFHFTSIDKFPDGDYLVSARHSDSIYKISRENGTILWRLGGVKSDFSIPRSARFSRQHHGRVHSQNQTHVLISLFDNAEGDGAGEEASNDISRGLYLSLHMDSMTVTLLQHYDHPNKQITNSRGSLHFLSNGKAFLGWAYGTLISEHSHNGTLLMQANMVEPRANNYRAYKLPWVGRPSLPPDVYVSPAYVTNGVENDRRHLDVYVSWNGATEVAAWKLYQTNAEGNERELISSTPRKGFESKLEFEGYAEFVVVEAIDSDDRSLGQSDVKEAYPKLPAGVLHDGDFSGGETAPGEFNPAESSQEESASEQDSGPGDTTTGESATEKSSYEQTPWPIVAAMVLALGVTSAIIVSTTFWKTKSPAYARLDGMDEEDEWIEAQLLSQRSLDQEDEDAEVQPLDSSTKDDKDDEIS